MWGTHTSIQTYTHTHSTHIHNTHTTHRHMHINTRWRTHTPHTGTHTHKHTVMHVHTLTITFNEWLTWSWVWYQAQIADGDVISVTCLLLIVWNKPAGLPVFMYIVDHMLWILPDVQFWSLSCDAIAQSLQRLVKMVECEGDVSHNSDQCCISHCFHTPSNRAYTHRVIYC